MRTEYITPERMNKVIALMRPQNALVMRLCLETGIRVGDAVSLRLDDMRGADKSIGFVAQKTGKYGVAKISGNLWRDLISNTGDEFVFPSRRSDSGHITRQTVWNDIKRANRIAGNSENVAPHSARKIFAVEHLKTEGLAAVQRELQHGDIGTTLTYCLSDKRLFRDNDEILNRLRVIECKLDYLTSEILRLSGNVTK